MKRAFLIPLIVLVLFLAACAKSDAKPTAEPKETTVAGEAAAKPEANTGDKASADDPAKEAPAAADFTEDFEKDSGSWAEPVIVTSQAVGHEPYVKVSLTGGALRFAIQDKETYVYRLFQQTVDGAAVVDVDFQNKGAINGGLAIVCMADKDMTSWYEVRVSAADNNYNFYQYDKKRKDDEGKNPYVLMGKGHMKIEEYFPTRPNHIKLTCTSSEMSLDVNNGKKVASQTLDQKLDGTMVGVGAMSADTVPASFDIDTFTLSQAK